MLVERKDVQKLVAINKIIAAMDDKFKANDYTLEIEPQNTTRWGDKIYYVIFNLINEYGVTIIISNIDSTIGTGQFFRKENQLRPYPPQVTLPLNYPFPTIWLYKVSLVVRDGKVLNMHYSQYDLAHELTHLLDYQAGNKLISTPYRTGSDAAKREQQYVNSPSEYNAFIISMLKKFFKKNQIAALPNDFETFKKAFFDYEYLNQKYYGLLNDKYKKKFMTRLYLFYVKLKEVRDSGKY